MGTYVDISIGNYNFLSSKNSFGGLLYPFSVTDLKNEKIIDDDGEEGIRRYFSTNVKKVKNILDFSGISIKETELEFQKLKKEKLEYYDENEYGMTYEEFDKKFNFENWYNAVLKYAKVLSNDIFSYENMEYVKLEELRKKKLSITEKIILDTLPFKDGFWGFDNIEINYWCIFRAILDAFPDDEDVILDYTALYDSGWCDEMPELKEFDVPKTIVLTEGKFDAEIISEAILLLYPHMSKFYSFINFDDFKVQGSSSFLTHYFKMFAASGIQNRVIALYDNDSAGLSELIDVEKIDVPDNFKAIHLPDIKIANNYPTIGPSGKESLNINGKACSIELFLGRDMLIIDGELSPIHWKGFNDKTKTYQGEVKDKSAIQKRFIEKIKHYKCGYDVQEDDINWLEMRELLKVIFNAFN